MTALDPRSVANAIISFAEEYGKPLTHLSLQKIMYFVHGKFLLEHGEPLISGYFEAWRYGPVHPLIYSTFQGFGAANLTGRATRRDIVSGVQTSVPEPDDRDVRLFIRESASIYLKMTAGRLVDLSHAPGTPWDVLTKTDDEERSFGMRITDDHIRQLFRRHKITVGDVPRIGEPDEESPPS